jgi:uncharacterized membrane protein YecN with MAPEG domain
VRTTGIYAALAALLVLILAVRVMMRRMSARIGIGDGGDHELNKRIRAHANAVEYLPLGLILLLLVELNQTVPAIVHAFGIVLLVGRVLHAAGLSRSSAAGAGRMLGITLSVVVIAAMALLLLWQSFVLVTA